MNGLMEVLQSEENNNRENWNIRNGERTQEWVKVGIYIKDCSHFDFFK